MTQLSDDCFAFGGTLLSVDDALARIEERVAAVVETETVPLGAARGRILANDVVAAMNLPPHANSAVDGYAFAHAGLAPEGETVLPVTGRAAAGHPLGRSAGRGEAIRIFTGAPMPEGTDTVMMQEDCVLENGRVQLKPGIRRGEPASRWRGRRRGRDSACRRPAAASADVGIAAALGCCELPVFRPLRVALLSTGDEVSEPGGPLVPGAIYDANRFMLSSLLAGLSCAVTDFGIRPDRAGALADTLAAARTDHDLIVTSGGVSTGDEDHVKSAIERLGSLHFWRLAIKPGRPVALGQIGGVPLIGLPGNPVAVVVTFIVLARPLILKLCGARAAEPRLFPVRAGFSYRKRPGRREYLRASLRREGDNIIAVRFPKDGAGILSSIVQSEGLAIIGEKTSELTPGATVDFLPFAEVLA